MNYILKEPWCLRGWKNKPYCICDFTSPVPPFEITEEEKDAISGPFAYNGGDPKIDQMIRYGMLRPAGSEEALDEARRYYNYGCLHFSSVIFSITGKCNSDAKSIPIIALTANAFDEDVQQSMQAGLNAHLSKPVEPDVLFETLEDLLQH